MLDLRLASGRDFAGLVALSRPNSWLAGRNGTNWNGLRHQCESQGHFVAVVAKRGGNRAKVVEFTEFVPVLNLQGRECRILFPFRRRSSHAILEQVWLTQTIQKSRNN